MKKSKILFLMEYPIDLPGGGQMSTQTLCEGLVSDEFEPVVCCPKLLSKKPEDYSFKIVCYKSDENREQNKISRILNFISRIGSFYSIIKSEKPDLIHVSMSESLISFGFLRCLGIFKRIPFVYTDRGLCYGYRAHSKACIRATLKRAARLICTTEFNADLWKKENVPCDVTVIHNTIGKAFDNYYPEKRQEMRQKYNIQDEDFVIGFAGRISEEKDWPFVPVIVKALKDAGLKFKVALVISVYESIDMDIVKEVKDGIINAIGEENLIYMQDLSQSEISDYYSMLDLFVMSSMFESFGKAAVEAMSRRCSVASTAVGGLREVIGKEENLYGKDSLDKLADRVRCLINDKDELEKDREFFFNRFNNNFRRQIHYDKHKALYREILNKS